MSYIVHRNRGLKRARLAREAFGIDPTAPLPCLLDLVETKAGLPVVVAPMVEGLAGACIAGRLLFVNGRQAAVRQRFTLAHELGHVRLGHDPGVVVDRVESFHANGNGDPYEIEANAFASEFLIPQQAVETQLPREPSLDEVVVVAAHYGTSAIMTLIRFKTHGRISKALADDHQAAIEDGAHQEAFARLGCTHLDDRLGTMEALPYLSPTLEGGHLDSVVRGRAEASPELARAIASLLTA